MRLVQAWGGRGGWGGAGEAHDPGLTIAGAWPGEELTILQLRVVAPLPMTGAVLPLVVLVAVLLFDGVVPLSARPALGSGGVGVVGAPPEPPPARLPVAVGPARRWPPRQNPPFLHPTSAQRSRFAKISRISHMGRSPLSLPDLGRCPSLLPHIFPLP